MAEHSQAWQSGYDDQMKWLVDANVTAEQARQALRAREETVPELPFNLGANEATRDYIERVSTVDTEAVCDQCGKSEPHDHVAESVLVRVKSHRAADKLKRVVGEPLDWHFTWADGGTFVLIATADLEAARAIKGITLAKPRGAVQRCESSFEPKELRR